MSAGLYFDSPRVVVLDDGQRYTVKYSDGHLLTTACPERIYWLRRELISLVSFYIKFSPQDNPIFQPKPNLHIFHAFLYYLFLSESEFLYICKKTIKNKEKKTFFNF